MVEPESIACPFEIVVDTREQAPYLFETLRANADKKNARYAVKIHRLAVPVGDYTIFGYPRVAVERKSKADLFGSVSKRENFEARLSRMDELDYAAVVIEAEWSEILSNPPRHSKLNPKSLFRTVLAWKQRFKGVHWYAMPGREAGEATTFRILERYWIEVNRNKDRGDEANT